jgi:diaminopimelate epimerase
LAAVNPDVALDAKAGERYPGRMTAKLMNGAGNAFLLADARDRAALVNFNASQIRDWAAEYRFDQFLVLENSDSADAFMRIWNCDGDEVSACGNGTRAAAWSMMQASGRDAVSIGTVGGLLRASLAGDRQVSVDMGVPRLGWQNIPLAREMDTRELDFFAEADGVRIERPGAVNMGNPHAVFFVHDVENLPIAKLGQEVELDPMFPERVNVGFAQIFDPSHIRLRVWERGAGLTAACGTGACAALVAAHRRGLAERSASIMADGGELFIEWRAGDDHVVLTGPVEDEGDVELVF